MQQLTLGDLDLLDLRVQVVPVEECHSSVTKANIMLFFGNWTCPCNANNVGACTCHNASSIIFADPHMNNLIVGGYLPVRRVDVWS